MPHVLQREVLQAMLHILQHESSTHSPPQVVGMITRKDVQPEIIEERIHARCMLSAVSMHSSGCMVTRHGWRVGRRHSTSILIAY